VGKINKEFKEAFELLAKDLHERKDVKDGIYKSKRDRTLQVNTLQNGTRFIKLTFRGSLVVIYDSRYNYLFLDSCGFGCNPSLKELLNTFCPKGYRFYSKNFSQRFTIYHYP
jgi:hypothetical protein